MNMGGKELLCSKCRKRVSYQILKRTVKTVIKDFEIEFDEYYGVCDECKAELYVPGLEDYNEERLEERYRKEKNLITIPQIKHILDKYNIEKRPLSKLLGFGELTLTRYLDGQIPSKKYSDILFQVLSDEQAMKRIVLVNQDKVSEITVHKVLQAIDIYERDKQFDNSAERIAIYIIHSGREVTNLFLQKILYYVKVISGIINGSFMILEPCEAWKFGPVFPSVYEKYKTFGKQDITANLSEEYIQSLLTDDEKKIVDFVLSTFGIYNAWFLMELTHQEEPWLSARNGIDMNDMSQNEINEQQIMDYFGRMDAKYNLKSTEGVHAYINGMRMKMFR